MTPPVHRKKNTNNGEVSFPALQCWNSVTRVATIAAEVDGRRVLCRIKVKDLSKKFRFYPDEPMQTVTENRTAIEQAAKNLIDGMKFEDDGSIIIRYSDL